MVQENPAGSSQGNEIEKVLETGQTTNRKTTTRKHAIYVQKCFVKYWKKVSRTYFAPPQKARNRAQKSGSSRFQRIRNLEESQNCEFQSSTDYESLLFVQFAWWHLKS